MRKTTDLSLRRFASVDDLVLGQRKAWAESMERTSQARSEV
ncbi:MAG TPA: hypothetical protein PLZ57_04010 [Pseudobdellovibrionaceae bacterium]|nr:hypothetical protein [Pseudobdellovibrionaceae bacterium]